MPKKINTSLHDTNTVGLGHTGSLINRKGLVLGSEKGGSIYGQINVASPLHVAIFDDFVGDINTAIWLATEGTDSTTSAAAILSTGVNGVLRLTTGDAGSGLAADTEQITTKATMFKAVNGDLVYETRVKLSAITTCWAFFGFTDTVAAALEAPIMSASSADTFTIAANDAVGWMFDTRMSTDKWWLTGVAATVAATHQNSGYAPVADTYEVLRIEVATDGSAVFFRNGVQVGSRMSGAVTASVALAPIMAVSKTSVAASMTCDVDYIHASGLRA